jgi:hypothetical protein
MPGHLVLREACAGVEMKGVSGSEAERLLEGVDADFDAVDVDFTGVTDGRPGIRRRVAAGMAERSTRRGS